MIQKLRLLDEERKKIKLGMYSYTYARVSVMRTFLIKKEDYYKLLKMSLSEITKFLQDSQYRAEINKLATEYSGIDLIEVALNQNLVGTFNKLKMISAQEIVLLIEKYSKRMDLRNIKTILRAKFIGKKKEEIKNLLIPVGIFTMGDLEKLIKKDSIEEILKEQKLADFSSLATAFEDFKKNNRLTQIENAFTKFYYEDLMKFTTILPTEGRLFKEFLETEIEILNIMTMLRLKKENLEKDKIKNYIIFSGDRVEDAKVLKMLEIEKLNDLISHLEKTKYHDIVKKASARFEIDQSLIEFDIFFNKYLLKKSILLLHQHPLTIDIILGYMFAKEIEVKNLKTIIKGKQLGLKESMIENMLVI